MISSTVFVPHTQVKVDYSLKHVICAGLEWEGLDRERTMGKRQECRTGGEENPLLNSDGSRKLMEVDRWVGEW